MSPFFDGVSPDVVTLLTARATRRQVGAGEPVVWDHEVGYGAVLLLSGSAKAFFTTSDGAQVMARLVRAPDAVLGNAGELLEALEDTQALIIGRAPFAAGLERSHRLAQNALRSAAGQVQGYGARLKSVAFLDVERRLAELLVQLSHAYGVTCSEGVRIEIPLTQESLADMLGVARRSVTRAFHHWARRGALIKRDGRFVLGPELWGSS